jgi:hypothetical protein
VNLVRALTLILLVLACCTAGNVLAAMRKDEQELPLKLNRLGEASIYQSSRARDFEGYRFIWQPSTGNGVFIRINRRVDGSALLATQFFQGDLAGTTATRVNKVSYRVVSANQFSLFRAYLRVADFWRIPVTEPGPGNQWTLEGGREGNYRWLTMAAPKDMYFIDAILYLVRLAGLDPATFLVKDAKSNWRHG